MMQEEFEQLIQDAGLNLLSKWAPRFLISLHVPIEIPLLDGGVVVSNRVQCHTLELHPSELAVLTPAQAQAQIGAFKKKLERAAKTKQGVVR